MKKRFIFFGVFTIIVTLGMFTGCPQKLGNKDIPKPIPKPKIAEELNEEKEQEILPEQYRIGFKIDKNSTKIAFSEDKKKIIIPGYQDVEKIFGYSEKEISRINDNTGNPLWSRMNKVLNTKNKQSPWQAYSSNDHKSNILYILYIADFVGLYQKKVPSMVDLTNAPDWLKELNAYRALTSNYAKTDADLEIGSLNPNAEPGNEQATISWNKISLVNKVIISWWVGEEEKTATITDERTSFVITGLENYKIYNFNIKFFNQNDKIVKAEWLSSTPRTGDPSLDFAKDPKDFVNEKSYILLKNGYKIGIWAKLSADKFSFVKNGENYTLILPKYSSEEDVFGFSDDIKEKLKKVENANLLWYRMERLLNYGNNKPSDSAYVNNWGGNVRWLLYLADFLNLYQAKASGMVDLTNVPDWFKTLMNNRKTGENFAKTDEQLQIESLKTKIEPGDKEVTISWNKISIVKKVVISWRIGEEKKTETITDDRTSFTITGLENYIEQYFYISFVGENDRELKKLTLDATPKTGNDSDFAQGLPDFINEKAHLLLKPEHGLYINTVNASSKFYFKNTNRLYIVVPNYQDAEKIFKYTEEEIEDFNSDNTWDWLWNRMYKLINLEGMAPWENFNVNDRGGNVRWLLHIADLLNAYQKKLPEMVDLTDAPDWFKTLMEKRKTGETFAKTDEEIEFDNSEVSIEAGNNQALIKWTHYPFVKKVVIKKWNKDTKKWEEAAEVSGSSESTISGLDNLKAYYFNITFFNAKGVKIKTVNELSVTPGSQDEANYAGGTADFVNDKADLLVKKEYKMDPWFKKDNLKFIFKAVSNDASEGTNFEFPAYKEAENIFNFTEEEKKLGFGLLDARIKKVLNCGSFVPSECAEINDWVGNVRWLLYLADFLNVYQAKLPNMADVSNAPDWFKELMAKRKGSTDSYIKYEYK